MIAWALALALLGGHWEREALAWADSLYPKATPYRYDLEVALDAYRQVAKRYPHSRAAWLGQGKCLRRLGCYVEAAPCFLRAGDKAAAAEGRLSAGIAADLNARRKPLRAIQIERVPRRRDEWIALLAKVTGQAGSKFFTHPFLALVRKAPGRSATVFSTVRISTPVDFDDPGALDCFLTVADLQWRRLPAAVVYLGYPAGDSYPNFQHVVAIRGARLREVQKFHGADAATFRFATTDRGFRVVTVATWKVWWPDVYEWRHGRFRFANRRNADVYKSLRHAASGPPRGYDNIDYALWMRFAALVGIEGRYAEAAKAWRTAERLCRRAIGAGSDSPYHDYGFSGSTRENLREIRRRLKWLRKREYGHWLPYRPYDWDLQVPPYRLGRARQRE